MASFNNVNAGDSANSSCIQQVVDVLKGTAGAGNIPVSISGVNDPTNFALDVQNQDGSNGRTFRARDSSGNARIQLDGSMGPQADPVGSGLAPIVNISAAQTLTNKTISSTNGSNNHVRVPAIRLALSITPSIPTPISSGGIVTVLSWPPGTERFQTDAGMHSQISTAFSSNVIPTVAGIWAIGAQVEFSATGGTYRGLSIAVNATSIGSAIIPVNSSSPATVRVNVSALWNCSTSDVVNILVSQDHTAAINLSTNTAYGAEMWMYYVGST